MSKIPIPAVGATLALVATIAGAVLPWARIGGRSRSGLDTADLFVALGSGRLPGVIAWVGRIWYAPLVVALIAWALTVLEGPRWARWALAILTMLSAVLWALFAWAAGNWSLFDVRWPGPVVALIGVTLLAACTAMTRSAGNLEGP